MPENQERSSLIEKAVAMDSTITPHFAHKKNNYKSLRGPFMQTQSGRKYYFLDPKPEDIHFPDIAAHLSKSARYNGGTNGTFYSVAQHCSLMCDVAPEWLKPYVLLHDAHEAYTGDATTPFQWALEIITPAARATIKELQRRADNAIYPAAGIPYPIPNSIIWAIKEADAAMLTAEKEQLLVPTDWNIPLAPAAPIKITPKSWDNALDEYMFNLEKWVFPNIRYQKQKQNKGERAARAGELK